MGTTPSKGENRQTNRGKYFSTLKDGEPVPDEYKVTVINTGEKKEEEEDEALVALRKLKEPPAPILEATDKRRYVTDSFNLLQILSAYQQILHHSSRNVADNQDRLITKIEPTEAEVQRNMQHIQKTGNELSSLESQLKTIQSMANAVQLAQDQLVHIISFLDQIEALIPPEFTKPDTPLKISRQTHPS